MSFAAKILKQSGDPVYLAQGIDQTGQQAWYIVMVKNNRVSGFLDAMKKPLLDLEQFGVVLASAYGDSPPESTVELILARYRDSA